MYLEFSSFFFLFFSCEEELHVKSTAFHQDREIRTSSSYINAIILANKINQIKLHQDIVNCYLIIIYFYKDKLMLDTYFSIHISLTVIQNFLIQPFAELHKIYYFLLLIDVTSLANTRYFSSEPSYISIFCPSSEFFFF